MHILFLCDYKAPYGGNFIASLAKLEDALVARGHTALWVFPCGAANRAWRQRLTQQGRRIEYIDDSRSTLSQARQLGALIDESQADVVHVHFGKFALSGLAALSRPALRLVWHYHSDFSAGASPSLGQRGKRLLKRIGARWVGEERIRRVAVSAYLAKNDPEYTYVPNALVPDRFVDGTETRSELRARLGLTDDTTLALVFGWSPRVKGADVAATALTLLQNEPHPYALGLVCGREYPEERMRAFLAETAGIGDKEPWLCYLPPIEDVFRYHRAADVLVSASRSEAFSYAILEAVSVGKPVVATDIPGVQWARALETVRFCPSEAPRKMADAILDAAREAATPEFLEAAARAEARVAAEFSIEGWVEGILKVYGIE